MHLFIQHLHVQDFVTQIGLQGRFVLIVLALIGPIAATAGCNVLQDKSLISFMLHPNKPRVDTITLKLCKTAGFFILFCVLSLELFLICDS